MMTYFRVIIGETMMRDFQSLGRARAYFEGQFGRGNRRDLYRMDGGDGSRPLLYEWLETSVPIETTIEGG